MNNHALDDSFLAMASPVRRAIVERLAEGPRTVGAASAVLGVSKPAISRHLKVLEQADVIERTVQGRTHVLSLRREPLREAGDWLDRHRRMWERTFEAVETGLRNQK